MKIENVVYILTNPQYPGYIKIGYASDLKQRVQSLNTGALVEFVPYAVYETPKELGDIEIHKIIELLNPILRASKFNGGKVALKEFFKLEPEEAFELLQHIAIVSGTEKKLYKVDIHFNKIIDNSDDKKKEDIQYKSCDLRKHVKAFCIYGEVFTFTTNIGLYTTLYTKIIDKVGLSTFKSVVLNDKYLKEKPFFSDKFVWTNKSLNIKTVADNFFAYCNFDKINAFKAIDYLVTLFPDCNLKFIYE